MSDQLYQIALLIDDLKNEELEARLNSMRNIVRIAEAFGKERTRDELLPYLADSVDDDDEVLLEMARALNVSFVPYIGGDSHIPKMFIPLQALAVTEDPIVREVATNSLRELSSRIADDAFAKHFYPMLHSFYDKEWFTARCSFCALLPTAYKRMKSKDTRKEMREMFVNLSHDKKAVVRRAVNKHLGEFVKTVEPEYVKDTYVEVFKRLSADNQDNVRTHSVENIVAFVDILREDDEYEAIAKVTADLAQDKSWRIRWNMAMHFRDIYEAVEKEKDAVKALVSSYLELLNDDEPEVQQIAASKLPEVALKLSDKVVVDKLLPEIITMAKSPNDAVREALAAVITDLIPIYQSQNKLDEFLEPYLDLVGDEEAKVKLAVIGKLNTHQPGPKPNQSFIDKILPILLPAYFGLVRDQRWRGAFRIRNSAVELIPLLAGQLGEVQFTESLADIVVDSLHDEACQNRQTASDNIRKLYEMFGHEWVSKKIIRKLTALTKHESYLIRIQSIRVIQSLAMGKVEAEFITNSAIPMLSELAGDRTANVKFNVAKCLVDLKAKFSKNVINDEVKPILQQLQNDKDKDVVYFATDALKAIEAQA